MSWYHYYCLRCNSQNNCKCDNDFNRFQISSKLRIPDIKNKVKFRKFLYDCPQFPNCVPDNLKPMFKQLLADVKYFDKTINGYEWTKVSKKDVSKANKNWYNKYGSNAKPFKNKLK